MPGQRQQNILHIQFYLHKALLHQEISIHAQQHHVTVLVFLSNNNSTQQFALCVPFCKPTLLPPLSSTT